MPLKVRYSAQAQRELEEIYSYSIGEWGQARADQYLDAIRDAMGLIASIPTLGRPFRGRRLGARKHNVGSHVILYKAGSTTISVIRVLHKRMLQD